MSSWLNISLSINRFVEYNMDTAQQYILFTTQAGLTALYDRAVSDPLPPPDDFQQIDWYHLALPAMIHCVCCVIALLVFLLQSARAVCK